MTAPDYADLRRLLAVATPGPWEAGVRREGVVLHYVEPAGIASRLSGLVDWMGPADAALIAAAVNALPHWLDEREALTRERDEAQMEYADALFDIALMRARLEAERAKVEAVEALADEWGELQSNPQHYDLWRRLLAALADGVTP